MPHLVRVDLQGELPPWCSAKVVLLELLRRYGETWGKEKVFEYGGPALKHFTIPEWGTFANMGAELGARAVRVGRPVRYSLALVGKPTVGGIDGSVVQRLGGFDLLPQSPPDALPPDP